MADILHDLPIVAPPAEVFSAISTPVGLNAWWTLDCEGTPAVGERYRLDFGPGYVWTGVVTVCRPSSSFELEIRDAMPDWEGTRVGFALDATDTATKLRFSHTGWPEVNAHLRTSSYCWAMYLRIMKRWVEEGEVVAYPDRLRA